MLVMKTVLVLETLIAVLNLVSTVFLCCFFFFFLSNQISFGVIILHRGLTISQEASSTHLVLKIVSLSKSFMDLFNVTLI